MARAKGPVKEDLRSLSGSERAAIFLLSLGEEHGAKQDGQERPEGRGPTWMRATG